MFELKTLALFIVTALAEIVGCYLPYLWLNKGAPVWVLVPAALSLALFVWLLTLHPAASGRVCSRLWWRVGRHGAGLAAHGERCAAVAHRWGGCCCGAAGLHDHRCRLARLRANAAPPHGPAPAIGARVQGGPRLCGL